MIKIESEHSNTQTKLLSCINVHQAKKKKTLIKYQVTISTILLSFLSRTYQCRPPTTHSPNTPQEKIQIRLWEAKISTKQSA